jgi:hypothetical protein
MEIASDFDPSLHHGHPLSTYPDPQTPTSYRARPKPAPPTNVATDRRPLPLAWTPSPTQATYATQLLEYALGTEESDINRSSEFGPILPGPAPAPAPGSMGPPPRPHGKQHRDMSDQRNEPSSDSRMAYREECNANRYVNQQLPFDEIQPEPPSKAERASLESYSHLPYGIFLARVMFNKPDWMDPSEVMTRLQFGPDTSCRVDRPRGAACQNVFPRSHYGK